jgi:hypothetical protein
MRLISVILLTFSDIALGNPRVVSAYRNAYLASERLDIEVRPAEARFTGEFHFRFTKPADRYNRTNSIAVCGVEVWLPNPPGPGPQEGDFWRFLNVSNPPVHVRPVEITPDGQKLLQKLLELKFTIAGREFPAVGIEISPKRDEFLDEPGSCCMLVSFAAPADLLSGNEPVVISYRQPLHESEGVRRLYYVPEFFGIPSKYWTSTTNRAHYSITVKTSPECSLAGSNGSEVFVLEPQQSITLTPSHYQPIRAAVKLRAQAKEVSANKDGQ